MKTWVPFGIIHCRSSLGLFLAQVGSHSSGFQKFLSFWLFLLRAWNLTSVFNTLFIPYVGIGAIAPIRRVGDSLPESALSLYLSSRDPAQVNRLCGK